MQLPQITAQSVAGKGGVRVSASDVLGLVPGHPPVRSLYIHTPFCARKCHYCDFYSFVDTRDQQAAFIERLTSELLVLAPHCGPLRTLFIGGGTPSLLRPELWERLLRTLRDRFDLSAIHRSERDELGAAEFTVECNPESASLELLHALRAGGVNRVSIGAQSFNHRHLKTLERWHDPENVERAVESARRAGIPRQSIDLIFAIPGQTLEEWDEDLRRALALKTTHLSCYNLTYEPNTAMTQRLSMGEFVPSAEELEEQMFTHTAAALAAAGLRRYEVSNFAAPGDESRHNIAYWVQEQWLAAGPSASAHVWAGADMQRGSARWKNVPRLGDYLESAGSSPAVDVEPPDPARLVRERIMMGLRLDRGMDIARLLQDAELGVPGSADKLSRRAGRLAEQGLLFDSDGRWRLTERGLLMCDGAAAQLMACVSWPA